MTEYELQARQAARCALSTTGNAAAILGYHAGQPIDPVMKRRLREAARLSTRANQVLNRIFKKQE